MHVRNKPLCVRAIKPLKSENTADWCVKREIKSKTQKTDDAVEPVVGNDSE